MLRSEYVCGQNEMIACTDFNSRHLWAQALTLVGMFGGPGLIAIVLARKSVVFQFVWHALFILWTLQTLNVYSANGMGIDGKNGCEYCDFSVIAMLAFGVVSLIPAAFIAVLTAVKEQTGLAE
jgi:hypothetical protein